MTSELLGGGDHPGELAMEPIDQLR